MTAYCDRQSVASESVVFLFEGERLRGEQTPQEVMVALVIISCCVVTWMYHIVASASAKLTMPHSLYV